MTYILVCEECDYLTEYSEFETGLTTCARCLSLELEVVEIEEEL